MHRSILLQHFGSDDVADTLVHDTLEHLLRYLHVTVKADLSAY